MWCRMAGTDQFLGIKRRRMSSQTSLGILATGNPTAKNPKHSEMPKIIQSKIVSNILPIQLINKPRQLEFFRYNTLSFKFLGVRLLTINISGY